MHEEHPHIIRHEEELVIEKENTIAGKLSVDKRIVEEQERQVVDLDIEHGVINRVPANEVDSGLVEYLEDGSISIPVLEEEIVVTKRTVVRERIVVGKRTENISKVIEDVLRKEKVEIATTGDITLEQGGGEEGENGEPRRFPWTLKKH